MNSLPELTIQNCVVVAPGHSFVLLLATGGVPDLSDGPFFLGIPHQTRVKTPLPEVHAPCDPGPDLSGPADAQRLCKNNMDKEEGYLRVPTTIENPPPFRGQYSRKTAPYCTGGRGVPAH